MRIPPFSCPHLLIALLAVAAAVPNGPARAVEAPDDPARSLVRASLSKAQEQQARKLFHQLADADYDTRTDALRKLVALGTPVLRIAKEFAKDKNAEIATQARSLQSRILLHYDGYLPDDPNLEKKLKAQVRLDLDEGHAMPKAYVEDLAKENGIEIYFDPLIGDQMKEEGVRRMGRMKMETTIAGALSMALGYYGLTFVVRGDVLVVTSHEKAASLQRQRYTFDWKHLNFDREEANRVGETLRPFFPAHSTEMHTGSSALSLIGVPGCIARAARMLKWLENDAPSAVWPPVDAGADVDALSEKLASPVSLSLNEDDLHYALQQLKKQSHRLGVMDGEKVVYDAPWPEWFRGLAPASVRLSDLPLGLVLRWLTSRAKFVGGQAHTHRLAAGCWPDGSLRLSMEPNDRDSLDLAIGGIDARFLTPNHLPDGAKADEVILEKVGEALAPHLALFPDIRADNDLQVIRGRLLVKGSSAAVTRALDLIRQWKAQGQAPVCAWHATLQASLDKKVAWNGKGLRAGTLLRRLRQLGNFAVLLQPAEDGTPPHFSLTVEQCELFEPGTYSVRALMDKLAETAKAEWSVHWGVVVLRPKPEF